jgi:hypothetical protein
MSPAADFVSELANELSTWPGVAIDHRDDGTIAVSYMRAGLGVIYPDRNVAELPFSGAEREALIAHGDAEPAAATPASTGVDHYVRGPRDIAAVLDLFDQRYRDIRGDDTPFKTPDSTFKDG